MSAADDVRETPLNTTLPHLAVVYSCGLCGASVEFNDEEMSCPDCLVVWPYDAGDGDTSRMPDEKEECGLPPRNTYGREEYDHRGRHWVIDGYQPCILPKDHTSPCHHPHTATSTPIDETGE